MTDYQQTTLDDAYRATQEEVEAALRRAQRADLTPEQTAEIGEVYAAGLVLTTRDVEQGHAVGLGPMKMARLRAADDAAHNAGRGLTEAEWRRATGR